MRDCDNCARCGRDGCKSWDCDFVPRKEAIDAYKKQQKGLENKGVESERGKYDG